MSALRAKVTDLAVGVLEQQQRIEFDRFRKAVLADFDGVQTGLRTLVNNADEVRRLLSELRTNRLQAQSALAQALFADSDQAGRHYPVNTAMRRVYDINLQRYSDAHRAAVRTAAVARMAVQQRFGVDLDQQTCTQLVDAPSTWASDICNASGVNYGAIRDPSVEIGPDAIRQMFVGDYVERLSHYVESYRFDYPYTSSEDLMILSLKDDVVAGRSSCSQASPNLLGAANDLTQTLMPLEGGRLDPTTPAWQVVKCPVPPVNGHCLTVSTVDGPRYSTATAGDTPPVPGRIDGAPPRGFEVVFDSGSPSSTDYPPTDDPALVPALVQSITLEPGVYRFSWYERVLANPLPVVDARLNSVPSDATVYAATERTMDDSWTRKFMFFEVTANPDGSYPTYDVGVFPGTTGGTPTEMSIRVAGLQLETVTGTSAADHWSSGSSNVTAADGPGLFIASTAPGWATFDDCPITDPPHFRNAWTYDCASLCSGGFGASCAAGEDPQTFCYWQLTFNIEESRLVGQGARFGGGFAFGNFNYRVGDVAANVVGTGVINCDSASGDACYSTAGVPFSLSHEPLGVEGDPSAYTVRTHSGSLYPVHLFKGMIENGRALAAERYLTNPLSPSDSSLIGQYIHTELRGRPITGQYRVILWDQPGFDFNRMEDVQLLIRYRYFTRTGAAHMCGGDTTGG